MGRRKYQFLGGEARDQVVREDVFLSAETDAERV